MLALGGDREGFHASLAHDGILRAEERLLEMVESTAVAGAPEGGGEGAAGTEVAAGEGALEEIGFAEEVAGGFGRGDAVRVVDRAGTELARGLSAYDRADADRIIGHKLSEVAEVLGYRGRYEMIHRDDMVLTKGLVE